MNFTWLIVGFFSVLIIALVSLIVMMGLLLKSINVPTLSKEPSRYSFQKPLLRRECILKYVDTAKNSENKEHKLANVKLRTKKYYPDSLRCGDRCFALVHEKNGVIEIKVRLNNCIAASLLCKHSSIDHSKFPKGKDWYSFKANETFQNKEEVFAILNESYSYVLDKYYG